MVTELSVFSITVALLIKKSVILIIFHILLRITYILHTYIYIYYFALVVFTIVILFNKNSSYEYIVD